MNERVKQTKKNRVNFKVQDVCHGLTSDRQGVISHDSIQRCWITRIVVPTSFVLRQDVEEFKSSNTAALGRDHIQRYDLEYRYTLDYSIIWLEYRQALNTDL